MNKTRREELHARQFGEQAERCRKMLCTVWGCSHYYRGDCDPHHVIPRSRGGLDCHTVPLCRPHHSELHTIGAKTFDEKYGVNLIAVAARLAGET